MDTYRPDIDGLRAIAVVSVVLFHAGTPGFGGGFLGVDVFFVISGFLITRLLTQPGAQSASLAAFYERRVRRIAPALVVVLAASTVAAFVLLLPYEMREFSRTLVAATAFVANFDFLRHVGYFQQDRLDNPLLHLWSLSVEEQFYLVYPLLLWALRRAPRKALLPALLAMLAASFALSAWLALFHAQAAFYSPPSRAWELLLGAVASLVPLRLPKIALEAGTLAALAMIAVPVWLFTPAMSWPGLNAALPCLGTALLLTLNDGRHTLAGRLLSLKPLVGIGLVSYSLYLWHWPIFAFYSRAVLRPVHPAEYAVLIALSLAAAFLSWRFVERPFRNRHAVTRATVFRAGAGAAAALLLIGGAFYATDGFAQRFPPDIRRIDAFLHYVDNPDLRAQFDGNCFADSRQDYSFPHCFVVRPDRPNIVLWGDSHAMNYYAGLKGEAQRAGFHLILAAYHSCRPALANPGASPDCAAFNAEVFRRLDRRIAAVILSAELLVDPHAFAPMLGTARRLAAQGIPVIVLGPSLEYRQPVPLYVERFVGTGNPRALDSAATLRPELGTLDATMRAALAKEHGMVFISVHDAVCDGEHCPMIADGDPVQFDTHHLTYKGSLLFGKLLWPKVAAALRAPPT